MAFQKSLILLVLVLGICQLVSAKVSLEEFTAAVKSLRGKEAVDFETTQKNMETIREAFSKDSAIEKIAEFRELGLQVARCLDTCKELSDPFATRKRDADNMIDWLVNEEREHDSYVNIINYLIECKRRY